MDEHHVGVYASKTDGHMVKAAHPKSLLHGSPVSSSLAAAIMNGKYVNAVPLYRLEQKFIRYGLAITRQNMANWMFRLGEEYLSVLYDHLHSLLYSYHGIQADETPILVNRDGTVPVPRVTCEYTVPVICIRKSRSFFMNTSGSEMRPIQENF